VTASLIMRQLASYPRQNGVAAALRELGRLERTLFTLDWIDDPELRRETGQELNKGESRNSLARAVFIHRLGEIRDRTYENQQHRASGLNLVVTAIVLWNTRYLERAVAMLRKSEDVPDSLLSHLSPLGWSMSISPAIMFGRRTGGVGKHRRNETAARSLRSLPQCRLTFRLCPLCVPESLFVTSGRLGIDASGFDHAAYSARTRQRHRLQILELAAFARSMGSSGKGTYRDIGFR